MPRNGIQWSKRALKQLRKLSVKDGQMVYQCTGALATFPECTNVKSLVNHRYGYRLRAGAYRVLFDYNGDVRIVSIEEVRKRDENTY
jgi:mRNA interferase RelE/StbE